VMALTPRAASAASWNWIVLVSPAAACREPPSVRHEQAVRAAEPAPREHPRAYPCRACTRATSIVPAVPRELLRGVGVERAHEMRPADDQRGEDGRDGAASRCRPSVSSRSPCKRTSPPTRRDARPATLIAPRCVSPRRPASTSNGSASPRRYSAGQRDGVVSSTFRWSRSRRPAAVPITIRADPHRR
jgi:hypothetical protein